MAILLAVALALLVMINKNMPEEIQRGRGGEATLTWDANKEPNIAGYRIYYDTKKRNDACPPGGYGSIIDAGNNTARKIDDLKKDTTYYFSITSYNTQGKESCFSDEVSKIVQ